MKGLRAVRIDVLVSLLEPAEAKELGLAEESFWAEQSGIQLMQFAIRDRDVPGDMDLMAGLVDSVAQRLLEGDSVAVHCRQSVGRSGLLAVAVLLWSGVDLEAALRMVGEARGLEVPETAAQLEWLRRFASRCPMVGLRAS